VLIDPKIKNVHQLDDQQKPSRSPGNGFAFLGTYDEPSKTMHIESIESGRIDKAMPRSQRVLKIRRDERAVIRDLQNRILGPKLTRRLLWAPLWK